jgi:hypothetical protein
MGLGQSVQMYRASVLSAFGGDENRPVARNVSVCFGTGNGLWRRSHARVLQRVLQDHAPRVWKSGVDCTARTRILPYTDVMRDPSVTSEPR